MEKCECVFEVVDRFGTFSYRCEAEEIHAGPHYDANQNYTWGAITGYDAWSKWRLQQVREAAARRAKSANRFKIGKRK